MKVIAKYVTMEAVKGKRDCLEVDKIRCMKPPASATGSKGLEDIDVETQKCEIGAEILHDFMLDEFTDHYKESEVKDNG